jgi:hypothetical protein
MKIDLKLITFAFLSISLLVVPMTIACTIFTARMPNACRTKECLSDQIN